VVLHDRPDWLIRATDAFGRLVYPFFARLEFHDLDRLHGLGGPLLVVSNHISNADPPLIGSFLTPVLGRRIHWLGKQEALEWPVFGPILARNAVIGVRRGEADVDAFRAAKRVLDEGLVLCIFPEGTRSPTGRLQEAKEGTAILASRSGARIVPIGISGTTSIWPRGQRFPHPRGSVTLRVGRPFSLEPISPGGARREALQAATRRIMSSIAELLPAPQRGVYADLVSGSAGERMP